MVRAKKKSEIITQARSRLAGMKSINEKLDLGNGCSTATVEAKLKETLNQLEDYNKLKSQTAAAGNEFERLEKELARLSKQILLGAAMKFDHDSDEYEMVGGVRMSDRKRSRPKSATPAMA
ncbi:MAG: hypothetical protein ACFB0D_06345 [Phormidesmis sp.]